MVGHALGQTVSIESLKSAVPNGARRHGRVQRGECLAASLARSESGNPRTSVACWPDLKEDSPPERASVHCGEGLAMAGGDPTGKVPRVTRICGWLAAPERSGAESA
jgi:hypothetical protein